MGWQRLGPSVCTSRPLGWTLPPPPPQAEQAKSKAKRKAKSKAKSKAKGTGTGASTGMGMGKALLHMNEPCYAIATFRTEEGYKGKGQYAEQLGAVQLLRPTPMGVDANTALGDRAMGQRESVYAGLTRGRFEVKVTCIGRAAPVVARLRTLSQLGGSIGSPGTLRGGAWSLEDCMVSEKDKEWVRAVAARETRDGVIYVHEASARALREERERAALHVD